MTKHTPEPWTWNAAGGDNIILDANREPVLTVGPNADRRDAGLRHRIVSCVNACAGINPEAVPEMLEALEAVIHATADPGRWVQRVADALAKARETH